MSAAAPTITPHTFLTMPPASYVITFQQGGIEHIIYLYGVSHMSEEDWAQIISSEILKGTELFMTERNDIARLATPNFIKARALEMGIHTDKLIF